MNRRILFILLLMVSTFSMHAQTGNPRGIYKLAGVNGKDGKYFKEPFDQYKICTDKVTLMMSINNKSYHIVNNDRKVFNYTGSEPASANDKSTLIYDSDSTGFKLKWWSNYSNHPVFPYNDWCIEIYLSGVYSTDGKVIVNALTDKSVNVKGKVLKGRWRMLGLMDELNDVKKEAKRMRVEYVKSRYYNRNFLVFGEKYIFETLNHGQGYYEEVEYNGNKSFKIIKDRSRDAQNDTRNIKWISDDIIAIEFKDGYRTDYQILEKIKDETPIVDYILQFWEKLPISQRFTPARRAKLV